MHISEFQLFETDYQILLSLKEVDGLAVMLIVSPEKKKKTDFTFMEWSEPYSLVVPKPEESFVCI